MGWIWLGTTPARPSRPSGAAPTNWRRNRRAWAAALVHGQFGTIRLFLDGNGRLGRLLIVLMLVEGGILRQPLPELSLFFKQHRSRYYELPDGVRQQGDLEAWIAFFPEGEERRAWDTHTSSPPP
jgi:Fic family protein